MRRHRSPGFTLIEATIVVAVAAALAAIAIPLYGIRLSRSQAAAALGEIATGQHAYERLLRRDAAGAANYTPRGLGLPAETDHCSVSTRAPTDGGGSIACLLKGRPELAGKTITLIRDRRGWHCASTLEAPLLPGGCAP